MKELNIPELVERDPEVLLHPASSISALLAQGPNMIVGGDGVHVEDAQGHRLLDGVAGLWCVNVGYGRQELAEVMKVATEKLAYYHSFSNASNPWQVALAEKLVSLAPEKMTKVFFGSSGSDANDTIIKIAWQYHGIRGNASKIKIIGRDKAYHGTSISTAALTGLGNFHKGYPYPLDYILRVDCPHYYTRTNEDETETEFCDRLIKQVEALIEREGADTIAAFFAEPIQGAGGIIAPPKGYFKKLKALLSAHDILLVADEVVCGYGRLGYWFGSEPLEIEPDLMASAKGLTSGYFPLSAAYMTEEIWRVLKTGSEIYGGFFHGYTYSGHPVGCAVALANLEIIERENLVGKARETGAYLHETLASAFADHPNVGEIRGMGMLAGVQLVEDKQARKLPDPAKKWPMKVAAAARENGVIVRPLPTVGSLAISPPLTFTRENVDTLVSTVYKAIGASC